MPTIFVTNPIASVLSYSLVAAISYFFADFAIKRLHNSLPNRIEAKKEYKETVTKVVKDTNDSLSMSLGKIIGKLERFLYIYSVFVDDMQLAAGWFVIKAFFSWISYGSTSNAKVCRETTEGSNHSKLKLIVYSLYIYGNILSLLFALVLGNVGLLIFEQIK